MRRRLRTATAAAPGRIVLGGAPVLNFSSNDYLGLSRHPLLVERAREWAARHGAGAQASRLVCGNLDLHEQVEAKLARLQGTEAALLRPRAGRSNAAVLPALLRAAAGQGEIELYADKLNHASLHHGCQAAGARQIRFRHNDLDHLESLLAARAAAETGGKPVSRFIVTESVFSMDGDRTDVARLADLADRYQAFVYLDEAHATGVLGPGGMGLAGLAPGRIDLAMGTFSKALGGFGAYVAGSRALCDYLVNACSGFIYTTALPPAVLGAMDAALDLVPGLDAERARLAAAGDRLARRPARDEADTGDSSTQIVHRRWWATRRAPWDGGRTGTAGPAGRGDPAADRPRRHQPPARPAERGAPGRGRLPADRRLRRGGGVMPGRPLPAPAAPNPAVRPRLEPRRLVRRALRAELADWPQVVSEAGLFPGQPGIPRSRARSSPSAIRWARCACWAGCRGTATRWSPSTDSRALPPVPASRPACRPACWTAWASACRRTPWPCCGTSASAAARRSPSARRPASQPARPSARPDRGAGPRSATPARTTTNAPPSPR